MFPYNLELCTWTSFVDVEKNFLGNRWAKNYKEFVEKLLNSLPNIGANMSIKVYFYIAMEDSNRISKQWKNATRDDGTNKWWLTTVGVAKGSS